MSFRPRGRHGNAHSRHLQENYRCIRQPFTLLESMAVAIRVEKLLVAVQHAVESALTALLCESHEETIEFFEGYGSKELSPVARVRQVKWWNSIVAPTLFRCGGFSNTFPRTSIRPPEPEPIYHHLGVFGRHGILVSVALDCGSGAVPAGYLDRHHPFSATIGVDVFAWMRDLLSGADVGRAAIVELAHHEVAHFSAYDTPHSPKEEQCSTDLAGRTYAGYMLRSVELFCAGRGRAALLHHLGYKEWTDEMPEMVSRCIPNHLNVLNCRFPLPRIAGWDVASRRKLFNRVGRRYFNDLSWLSQVQWPGNWPSAAIGLAIMDTGAMDPAPRPPERSQSTPESSAA